MTRENSAARQEDKRLREPSYTRATSNATNNKIWHMHTPLKTYIHAYIYINMEPHNPLSTLHALMQGIWVICDCGHVCAATPLSSESARWCQNHRNSRLRRGAVSQCRGRSGRTVDSKKCFQTIKMKENKTLEICGMYGCKWLSVETSERSKVAVL